jgi:hypothetical protein
MNTFMSLERATMQWLVQSYQRRTLRWALRQAHVAFARRYPEWVAALFDEYFINAHVLPMMVRAAETNAKVTPVQVADAWARQVSFLPTSRQKHTARVIPIATHFLCMVADELSTTQVGPQTNRLVETAVG